MQKNNDFIYCPLCGAEYLPCELYVPDSFISQVRDIEKDHCTKRISYYTGKPLMTKESYKCDHCDTPFVVTASVRFTTYVDKDSNFAEDYKVKLRKSSVVLKED